MLHVNPLYSIFKKITEPEIYLARNIGDILSESAENIKFTSKPIIPASYYNGYAYVQLQGRAVYEHGKWPYQGTLADLTGILNIRIFDSNLHKMLYNLPIPPKGEYLSGIILLLSLRYKPLLFDYDGRLEQISEKSN